ATFWCTTYSPRKAAPRRRRDCGWPSACGSQPLPLGRPAPRCYLQRRGRAKNSEKSIGEPQERPPQFQPGRMAMAEQQARSPYATEAEYWRSAATRAWAEQHERQDRALAGLAEATLDLAAPQPGERVLDIGCGAGTTLLELAARVGPTGHVWGAAFQG